MKQLLIIALLSISINTNSASAQSLQESANFANLYCMQYFSGCFPGREYQQVVVNRSQAMSANCIAMSGTVTFLDAFGLPKNNYFELVMTLTSYNMIEVKFSKLNQVFGSQYWEYCNNTIPVPAQQAQQTQQTVSYQPSSQTKNTTVDDYRKQQDIIRSVQETSRMIHNTNMNTINNIGNSNYYYQRKNY